MHASTFFLFSNALTCLCAIIAPAPITPPLFTFAFLYTRAPCAGIMVARVEKVPLYNFEFFCTPAGPAWRLGPTARSSLCVKLTQPLRNAMTGILVRLVRTLLLVAVMASRAAGPDADQPILCGGTATCFVCVNDCTSTGHLSSCGLFLNWAGFRRPPRLASQRISASKRSMSMLGPAPSWRGRGALLVLRLTYVTNRQVKQ